VGTGSIDHEWGTLLDTAAGRFHVLKQKQTGCDVPVQSSERLVRHLDLWGKIGSGSSQEQEVVVVPPASAVGRQARQVTSYMPTAGDSGLER
jgi:hypothetical protein